VQVVVVSLVDHLSLLEDLFVLFLLDRGEHVVVVVEAGEQNRV